MAARAISSSGVDALSGSSLWRKYVIPAPGEPGSETWRTRQRLADRRWRHVGHRLYDPATDQVLWGTGNPVPWSDPFYRPGDNLYTNSLISWDPDTGKMNWYHQYTPGDMWDYDEEGSNIRIDVTGRRTAPKVFDPCRRATASSARSSAPTASP